MNYIQEINSFYNYQIENPLTASEQALWHRLMAYCNSFNWKSEFSLTNSRLVEDLAISRQQLDRCRNSLVQKGLVSYRKGTGNQCGFYKINPFNDDLSVKYVTQSDTQSDTQAVHSTDTSRTQYDTQAVPLDKHKQNINKTKEKSIKKPKAFTPPTLQEIIAYCNERGVKVDPQAFYNYYTADNNHLWEDKNGTNVKSWKQKILTWARFEKPKEQTRDTSYDLTDF